MPNIRNLLMLVGMLLSPLASADVHVNIGVYVPTYPQLVVVPGYPVYYAPRMQANFFFYDGMYWVYEDDYWYTSEWYDGPWWFVEPEFVPVFILRVPVRYYHRPPPYFIGWRQDAPPRWGSHWGHDWEQHRRGWDRWDRNSPPTPAPPPVYQQQYSGDRYPRQVEQQQDLRQQNYRYQPRDPVVQKHYQERSIPIAPAQQERQRLPEDKNPRQQDIQRAPEDRGSRQQDKQRSETRQQGSPAATQSQPPQEGGLDVKRSNPAVSQQGRAEVQDPRQQPESADRHRGQQERQRLPEDKNPRQQDVQRATEDRDFRQQDKQRYETRQQGGPAATQSQPPQEGGLDVKRSNPAVSQQGRAEVQDPRQQPESADRHRGQQKPRKHGQQDNDNRGERGQGQERGRDRNQ